jgi:hypothetical protein
VLVRDIRNNSWDALAEFGDLTQLPDEAARSLIDVAEARINEHIPDAAQGAYAYGSHDIGQALVLLNLTHPDVARWEPIYALLDDRRVAGRHKRGACADLAQAADRLRPEVRARLAELATAMLDHPIAPPDRHEDRFSALGPAAARESPSKAGTSARYRSLTPGYWVLFYPGAFSNGYGALHFCTEHGITDENNCVGRYFSSERNDHELSCHFSDPHDSVTCVRQ